MARLTSVSVFGAASAGASPAIVDLDIVTVNGQLRLYALDAGGSRLTVYDMSGRLLSNAALPASLGYLSTPQLEVLTSGTTMVAIPFGLTNSHTGVMQLNPSGGVSGVLRYASGTALPVDLREVASLVTDSGTLVFGAAGGTGRLVAFRLGTEGSFTPIASTTLPGAPGAHITATTAALIPGGAVLVTTTAQGLFVHDIGATGGLSLRAALPQLTGLGLAEISATAIVTSAQGATFVLVTGSGSSSVAVLQLVGTDLIAVDHSLDTRTTRFGGATVLETLQIGDRLYVVVAGGDDGFSLFTLLPNGRLIHLATLEDRLQTTLESGGAIALSGSDTVLSVFVSGGDGTGITRLDFDIGPAGAQIIGGAGRINGTTGSDILLAGAGTTQLVGGAGHDILANNGQAVELTGGTGADIFVLSPAHGTIRITDFNPAQDRIDLTLFPMLRSLAQVTVRPTATGAVLIIGATVIEITSAAGTTLPSSVFQDHLHLPIDRLGEIRLSLPLLGTPAADSLTLGLTAAMATGEGGDDTITGSPGNDTLFGGAGADRLYGADGNDSVNGGTEDDLLWGGNGNDTLHGEAGNDTLQGGRDHDLIYGGLGNDYLTGENGNDTLHGEAGNDSLFGGAANDQLFGGDGSDSLSGGTGNDHLEGGAQPDELYGDDGNDTLLGGQSNDTLYGGAGQDRLFGDQGFDTIYGGLGDDHIEGGTQADFLNGDDGNDTIYGGQGRDLVSGNAGNDLLFGGADEDNIFGGLNNDTIFGGDGDDRLFGGVGFDTIYGGWGNDRIQGEDGADFIHGDDGNDTIFGGNGFDVVSGNAGDDVLYGGPTQDWMFGGWHNDLLDGGSGDDFIFCGIGNDTAYGQEGNDNLNGEWGDDLLYGGLGNDTLRAGPGNDTLYGGPGADRFMLAGGGQDRIMDFDPFEPGEVIVLTGFGLTGGWANLRSTRMTDTPDGVRIDLGSGHSVTLIGVTIDQLSSNDFIL